MKSRNLIALLFCLFSIGYLSSIDMKSGITIAPVIVGKTSNSTVGSITLPSQYIDKEGKLTIPLNIIVYQDNTAIYKDCTNETSINIPLNLTGTFYLEVAVGDVVIREKIHLWI